ncbi:MAG: P-loop NTPase [Armatimonadetes bacterium]|nr:P-loop NTPase [Armatimonadota bacterium]
MKIAIASGKGGTGKTTLATNLASFLSESRETVLVDLDVEEPNSGLFIKGELFFQTDKFKMVPKWEKENCILCGNCQKVCNFNAIIKLPDHVMVFSKLCHSCYACSELCSTKSLPMQPEKIGALKHYKTNSLNFVESKLDVGQEQAVPLISQTKKYVDEQFQKKVIKIFDSPPGTSCPVIEATKNADFVILVTEPTPFGLYDLKLAVETMRELGNKTGVVINRYGIGNDDVIDYCRKEKIDILARISNDRKIAELYSQGKLIYKDNSEFRFQLEKISDYLFLREA